MRVMASFHLSDEDNIEARAVDADGPRPYIALKLGLTGTVFVNSREQLENLRAELAKAAIDLYPDDFRDGTEDVEELARKEIEEGFRSLEVLASSSPAKAAGAGYFGCVSSAMGR